MPHLNRLGQSRWSAHGPGLNDMTRMKDNTMRARLLVGVGEDGGAYPHIHSPSPKVLAYTT